MKNKKLGLYFYYVSLLIALVIFIFNNFAFKQGSFSDGDFARYKNLFNFMIFGFVLPLGIIIRELFTLPYKKNLMIIKFIVYLVTNIVGILLWILIPTAIISQVILYVAFASLMYILVPTNRDDKKEV